MVYFIMLTEEQIKAYFARIDLSYDKHVIPSIEQLISIHAHQTTHIDVTNYQMHQPDRVGLEPPISIEIKDIYSKIVTQKSDGYCYENNLLLYAALKTLGYDAQLFEARIHRTAGLSSIAQHAFIKVTLDDKSFLVDAGYGGDAPIPVLSLEEDTRQKGMPIWYTTSLLGNRYKFMVQSNQWTLYHFYHKLDEYEFSLKPLYTFTNNPCELKDLERGNLSVCKNMNTSPFKQRVFFTRFSSDTKISLTQDQLLISRNGCTKLNKPVTSIEMFLKYYDKYFKREARAFEELKPLPFGNNTPTDCLTWYKHYKEQKKQASHTSQSRKDPVLPVKMPKLPSISVMNQG